MYSHAAYFCTLHVTETKKYQSPSLHGKGKKKSPAPLGRGDGTLGGKYEKGDVKK
jgi:hypothetical protein